MANTSKNKTVSVSLNKKVRGSETGRPLMAIFDQLGKRWSMRIMWELSQSSQTFNNLQRACDNVSPSTLHQRIRELLSAKLITKVDEGGYALTELGNELMETLSPLREWSEKWVRSL